MKPKINVVSTLQRDVDSLFIQRWSACWVITLLQETHPFSYDSKRYKWSATFISDVNCKSPLQYGLESSLFAVADSEGDPGDRHPLHPLFTQNLRSYISKTQDFRPIISYFSAIFEGWAPLSGEGRPFSKFLDPPLIWGLFFSVLFFFL
jgi:hypothetical protein